MSRWGRLHPPWYTHPLLNTPFLIPHALRTFHMSEVQSCPQVPYKYTITLLCGVSPKSSLSTMDFRKRLSLSFLEDNEYFLWRTKIWVFVWKKSCERLMREVIWNWCGVKGWKAKEGYAWRPKWMFWIFISWIKIWYYIIT